MRRKRHSFIKHIDECTKDDFRRMIFSREFLEKVAEASKKSGRSLTEELREHLRPQIALYANETRAGSFDPVSGLAFGDGAPPPGTVVQFAAGDAVPEWILRVEGEAVVTFKEDATAERHGDGSVTVHARRAFGVLRIEGTKPGGRLHLIGAPTEWRTIPSPIGRFALFESRGRTDDPEKDDEDRKVRVYPMDGEFVVAEGGMWLPGSYATEAGARRAAENFTYEELVALRDMKGLFGGAITDADLDELAAVAEASGR